jgi:hypothetical protein
MYGDLFTQQRQAEAKENGEAPMVEAYLRNDGLGYIFKLQPYAKVDIVFTINLPVRNFDYNEATEEEKEASDDLTTHEDNYLNGAKIWLGSKSGNPVVATNPNEIALMDIAGIDYDATEASEFYYQTEKPAEPATTAAAGDPLSYKKIDGEDIVEIAIPSPDAGTEAGTDVDAEL